MAMGSEEAAPAFQFCQRLAAAFFAISARRSGVMVLAAQLDASDVGSTHGVGHITSSFYFFFFRFLFGTPAWARNAWAKVDICSATKASADRWATSWALAACFFRALVVLLIFI